MFLTLKSSPINTILLHHQQCKFCLQSLYYLGVFLYQLIFKEYLPIEAISGGDVIQCEGCGKKIMKFQEGIHKLAIKKEYLNNPLKVYRTDDVLTEQLKGCTTFSAITTSPTFKAGRNAPATPVLIITWG